MLASSIGFSCDFILRRREYVGQVQTGPKETFKCHMTLRERVCSNRQNTALWGRGVGQIVI